MKVFNKDWIIDLQKSILWQYDNAQKLSDLIIQKGAWYKSNVTDFIVDFFWNIFNLRTADDFGLNIWGKILNFPRQIVLSYGEHAGEVYELTKEQYRFLLIGQVLKFQMDATIPEINKYLSVIFPNNNGSCYVIDNQDMTINYNIADGFLTEDIKALVDNYEFLPRPAGVKIVVGIAGTYVFRLETISEGVPTTQLPQEIQLTITKNGTAVEPRISNNGYEITVSDEDVLSWQLTYNGTVIDSNSNITISQNTTQYGYITRFLQITPIPSTTVGINPMSGEGKFLAYIENGKIRTQSSGAPVNLPETGLYVISKSSIRWGTPRFGILEGYGSRSGDIDEIDDDVVMTVHLLPNDYKVKTTKTYDSGSYGNTPIEDILETEIDETGSYHIVIKGEQGGVTQSTLGGHDGPISYTNRDDIDSVNSAGGILEFDIELNQGDIFKLQKIKGGLAPTHMTLPYYLSYAGGAGISFWIKNNDNYELIAVVGGGASGGTFSDGYNSAGGGGYNGGVSSGLYPTAGNGFDYEGHRGNSTIENQGACGSTSFFNSSATRTSGYGGSSYIKDSDSRVSNIVEVYGKREPANIGEITQGNKNEGRITITKNS